MRSLRFKDSNKVFTSFLRGLCSPNPSVRPWDVGSVIQSTVGMDSLTGRVLYYINSTKGTTREGCKEEEDPDQKLTLHLAEIFRIASRIPSLDKLPLF